MSSDELFSIPDLSFILHYDATAAAESFHAISTKAAFQVVQLPNPSPLNCCKYPYSNVSLAHLRRSNNVHLH